MQISTGSNSLLAGSLAAKTPVEPSVSQAIKDSQTATKVETERAIEAAKEAEALSKAKSNQEKINPNELADAIKQLNETVKLYKGDLHFTVDNDTSLQVVKVVDKGTKEVIRQIPSPEVLRIARAIDEFSSLMLKDQA